MAESTSLRINQNQQLTQHLSPRQLQYVRLLEMSGPEVEEEVQRHLDDNPALEALDTEEPAADANDEALMAVDAEPDDDPADWPAMQGAHPDMSQWQIADDGPDLATYLNAQINQQESDPQLRDMAHYVVGNLDSNGYLTRTRQAMADDLSIATGRDVTVDDVQRALDVVRGLEPVGVGAVDLRDCLLLQIRRRDEHTEAARIAEEVLADYFDLFSKKHYDRLRALLGLDNSGVLREAISLILTLNPKPGAGLGGVQSTDRASQISPDVAVDIDESGRFNIWLLSRVPQLQIAVSFMADDARIARSQAEKNAQAFVKLKRDEAEMFISALRQRGSTLVAVMEAIVRRQIYFFHTGDKSQLRPMILRDVAADTDMDVSMVSRATAGKYVATPMGTFPLKMFFSEAPTDNADASSHQLQHALTDIIDNEDPHHPLSDQALVDELAKRGLRIARRTVTKYRERMGIPVGRLRKKI